MLNRIYLFIRNAFAFIGRPFVRQQHIHHVEIKVARSQDPAAIARETARILQELADRPKEPA